MLLDQTTLQLVGVAPAARDFDLARTFRAKLALEGAERDPAARVRIVRTRAEALARLLGA